MNTTIIARVSKQANINKVKGKGTREEKKKKKPSSRFITDKGRTLTESERQCTFFLYHSLYLPGLCSQFTGTGSGTLKNSMCDAFFFFSLLITVLSLAIRLFHNFILFARETYMFGMVKKIMARYIYG